MENLKKSYKQILLKYEKGIADGTIFNPRYKKIIQEEGIDETFLEMLSEENAESIYHSAISFEENARLFYHDDGSEKTIDEILNIKN